LEWHGSRNHIKIMATQMAPESEEMDDLYESDETAEAPETETEEGETPESIDAEEAEGDTAVVDNKVLAPAGAELKEGDEITVVVVKKYGEESEIRFKSKSSGKEVQPPAGMMDSANAELDAMDQG